MNSDVKRYFATAPKGLEAVLAEELVGLGARNVQPTGAGASFEGELEIAYRACLWSRVANRILLPLKSFPAPDPDKLYSGVRSIHWTQQLNAQATFAIDFTTSRSNITHTHFGALRAKDAIVDQFRAVTGERPSIDTVRPGLRINVHLQDNQATVSIDLSGDSLHRRGYREKGVPAPLKENVAAALLILADWPRIAAAGGSLIDPMSGSGTIPIEAALMATDTAPGLLRDYWGFLDWTGHDPKLWDRLVQEASERSTIKAVRRAFRIVGYDRDFRATRAAIANLERAGLVGVVHFEKREFETLEPIETRVRDPKECPLGIVVMNPPYGERLGDEVALKPLYKSMGDIFKKRFKGWNGFILTGTPELAKSVGLKPARRHVVFNGALECRFLKFELY